MNQSKLQRIIYCLYAVAGIKAAVSLYWMLTTANINELVQGQYSTLSTISLFSTGLLFSVAIGVLSFFIAEALKKQQGWGWVAALTLFVVGLPSLAFPASLIGGLTCFDVEIREHFIKQFDFKF